MMKKMKKQSIAAISLSMVLFTQMIPGMPVSAEVLTNDRYVYEFLTNELNLPHASASGLMANIAEECGFVPTASCVDTNGQISYGLMQWNGPRFEQLKVFCAEYGYAYDTLEGQLAFLAYDLTGLYIGYYDYLLYGIEDSEQGAYDAAYFWAAQYEVCHASYFEVRANLAQDYYYPAYQAYAPASAVVFQDDFYAVLTNCENGLALTDDGKSLKVQQKSNSSSQIWRFVRQEGSAYRVINCSTGRQLDPDGGTPLWLFYETESGYMLKPTYTEDVLACSQDGTLQFQISGGSASQSFQMEQVQPASVTKLNAAYSPAPSVTSFSWERAANADAYRLKIYSGTDVKGTPQTVADNLTALSYEAVLPAGTYTAVLESVNACGAFAGEPVVFRIEQQEPVDLGSDFYAKISWGGGLQYLTRTEDVQVRSNAVDYQEDQLWQFVRNEDGSYGIYADGRENVLSVQETSRIGLDAESDAEKSWMIYGNEQTGYILQAVENTQTTEPAKVLSATEGAQFAAVDYKENIGQRFEISDYNLTVPVVCADASGGVLEPVRFRWNAADCVNGYMLKVLDADGFVVATMQVQKDETMADITLHEGDYTAEVSAVSSVTGEMVVSEPVSFCVKQLPERPMVGMDIPAQAGTVSFYWNRCTDADIYTYQICDAKTGKTILRKEGVKGFSDEAFLKEGQYMLTVSAKNEEGTIVSEAVDLMVYENAEGVPEVSMKSILAAKKQYTDAEAIVQ